MSVTEDVMSGVRSKDATPAFDLADATNDQQDSLTGTLSASKVEKTEAISSEALEQQVMYGNQTEMG